MNRSSLPQHSGYTAIDSTADPWEYIRRLDGTSVSSFWRNVKQRTFALLEARPGYRVLDVGCGTGDDVRSLARLVGANGRAVGVDHSATMIREARRRAEGTGLPVEYREGDVLHLDLPDQSFDGCRAERILQHLDVPRQALGEMVRVTRSGGRIVVVEPDYGTLSILGADRLVTRTILSHRVRHFRSGRIGSRLPALFLGFGLTDIAVSVLTATSTNFEADRAQVEKHAARALSGGFISAEESARWLADLERTACAGEYRQAVAVFIVSGRAPEDPVNHFATRVQP